MIARRRYWPFARQRITGTHSAVGPPAILRTDREAVNDFSPAVGPAGPGPLLTNSDETAWSILSLTGDGSPTILGRVRGDLLCPLADR
ncbi:hypothetical protein Poly21_24970 [Allorhodopirellula heiligendammensis]|uniref:Uncharacterized protein n=1 Tax=Allorhodopirellula heiligendammensis TaxID=2714739 RepID=A0A5C6BTX9_9BACT|nr:hypothetical protein Poly21_24970 [Allorhodopirellula heiligendammensis]